VNFQILKVATGILRNNLKFLLTFVNLETDVKRKIAWGQMRIFFVFGDADEADDS
jgi:hypothetical protein